ncbi:MAG TPA: hypothetical protein VJY39_20890 [Acidisphaera sp.]|nr:hypothetical protein [Acidisphaera sp.]
MDGTPYEWPNEGKQADVAALARDWIALVESELAGWMTDREAQETWTALLALWTRGVEAALRGAGDAGAGGGAARPAAGGAAPDAGDAERLELARRLAALEARIAELERKPRRRKAARKSARKSPGKSDHVAGGAAGADRGGIAKRKR